MATSAPSLKQLLAPGLQSIINTIIDEEVRAAEVRIRERLREEVAKVAVRIFEIVELHVDQHRLVITIKDET